MRLEQLEQISAGGIRAFVHGTQVVLEGPDGSQVKASLEPPQIWEAFHQVNRQATRNWDFEPVNRIETPAQMMQLREVLEEALKHRHGYARIEVDDLLRPG